MHSEIRLIPLEPTLFESWLGRKISNYAKGLSLNSQLSEPTAKEIATHTYRTQLPQGLRSPHNWIFNIEISGVRIGDLWYQTNYLNSPVDAYLVDIELDEKYQGQGLAKKTIENLQLELQKNGILRLTLHVFGSNQKARRFYSNLGFNETNIIMSRELS